MGAGDVALSDIDRGLLDSCLARQPKSWEDFVDRFLGLVVHVIRHSADSRSIRLSPADYDDLAAEVFLAIIKDDFAVLRRFRRESSLATYLTVVARRVVVRELLKRKENREAATDPAIVAASGDGEQAASDEQAFDREEIEALLSHLEDGEARLVRLYHLEGKSYREISAAEGLAENSIGPALSRARAKMRDIASARAAV